MPKGKRGGKKRREKVADKTSADGVISYENERTIKTFYRNTRGRSGVRYWKNEVLEAKTDGNGNVTFSYASGGVFEEVSSTTKDVTFQLFAGAVDGQTFGIDWSKVKSVSGQTYSVRDEARKAGLKWNGATKRWER